MYYTFTFGVSCDPEGYSNVQGGHIPPGYYAAVA